MYQQEENRRIPTLLDTPRSTILKSRGQSLFYGVSEERIGNVLALKLVSATGSQRAVHYHDIVSPMDFDGNCEIILLTTAIKITIKGKNLEKLYDYIIQHRVMWVKEPQTSFMDIDENEVEISAIHFEEH